MTTVRKMRADVVGEPFRFSAEERARLDALSDEDIERLALEDSDNLPLSAEELSRMVAARTVRRVRERAGLSQANFAERYRIDPAQLRDWEQGRSTPDSTSLAYLRVIEREPQAVARALAED